MDTIEQVYDALNSALGAHENGAVSAIGTLKHQRDDARRMVVNAREAIQEAIGRDAVNPLVKFHGGDPVLLCSVCHILHGRHLSRRSRVQ